jgi:lysophospholipase L1-like esterase
MKAKSIFHNLGLIILGLIFAFCLAEFFLRLSLFRPLIYPQFLFTSHPINGFTLQPGFSKEVTTMDSTAFYKINNQGIRSSKEYQSIISQDPRVLPRIFVIGDSFTFGFGVNEDETYTYQLEDMLTNQGLEYQVINLGIPAYSTKQSYNRLLEITEMIGKPDIVIYMFCPNDPKENIYADKNFVYKGFMFSENYKNQKNFAYLMAQGTHHSYLLALLRQTYIQYTTIIQINNHSNQGNNQNKKEVQELINQINNLKSWTSKNEIPLLVINTGPSQYDEILRSYFLENDTPFLESINYFNQNNLKQEQVRFKHDGHWNFLGNQIIAKAIFEFLVEKNWVQ